MTRMELPLWYDLHAHFRQGDMIAPLLKGHREMGCAGILAMPNTAPPVAKVFKDDDLPYWSMEGYMVMLREGGGDVFDDIIIPLYLTRHTTPDMIAAGAERGVLRACKYYPPHGTTGAEFGCPMDIYMENGVLKAMEEHGVVLCVHGEEHGLCPEDYFNRRQNAEEIFYRQRMPRVVEKFPNLKVVAEHVTTKVATDFVRNTPENIGATITPQHLLYTLGHLLQGLNYHLYCLPLLKFDEDRHALREAVIDPQNTKFFAGTDSAPHAEKVTECGCAAGCYTGLIAPQLYAQAFEESGLTLQNDAEVEIFKNFLCLNGPRFYGLDIPEKTFVLEKSTAVVQVLKIGDRDIIPLSVGMNKKTDEPTYIDWCIA